MEVKSDIHFYHVHQACTHACKATQAEGIQWFKDICHCLYIKPRKFNIELECKLKRIEWGPSFWMIIHVICLMYDQLYGLNLNDYQSKLFRSVILRIWKMLPCKTCSDSCNELKAYEQIRNDWCWEKIKSGHSLYEWSVNYHNQVNLHINPQASIFKPSETKHFHQAYIYIWGLGPKNRIQYKF